MTCQDCGNEMRPHGCRNHRCLWVCCVNAKCRAIFDGKSGRWAPGYRKSGQREASGYDPE